MWQRQGRDGRVGETVVETVVECDIGAVRGRGLHADGGLSSILSLVYF